MAREKLAEVVADEERRRQWADNATQARLDDLVARFDSDFVVPVRAMRATIWKTNCASGSHG